ncbi:helix-turn-helix domain-containing protein [Okeania hirsuta]|uniref:Helix-turn-helix domain-containing protein n=1 Tax=Okeania hirsuta TaxID=1458930 RepID=A0A3N6PTB7_9CYAN|nr:helix-turn-helix domain-containing protein [Okeania hirsuta]RQH53493.1 helix-turn-helix domain-containing protein [Okeania hirsuta]
MNSKSWAIAMPRLLKLEPHKSIEELEKLYRQTQDPIERTRWQILWLIAKGHKVEEVAEVTGYRRGSIYRIVGRYNRLGIDGLKDRRHQHQGPETLLSEIDQALVVLAIGKLGLFLRVRSPAPDVDGDDLLIHQYQGPETLLSEIDQAFLWQALQEPPVDGGLSFSLWV